MDKILKYLRSSERSKRKADLSYLVALQYAFEIIQIQLVLIRIVFPSDYRRNGVAAFFELNQELNRRFEN